MYQIEGDKMFDTQFKGKVDLSLHYSFTIPEDNNNANYYKYASYDLNYLDFKSEHYSDIEDVETETANINLYYASIYTHILAFFSMIILLKKRKSPLRIE